MKTLKALKRFLLRKELSDKEIRLIKDFFHNVKVCILTIIVIVTIVFLLHESGFWESRITETELKELDLIP